jgi:hypothetical protein
MRIVAFTSLALFAFAAPDAAAKDVCPDGYRMIKTGEECTCRTRHNDKLTSNKPEITFCAQKS